MKFNTRKYGIFIVLKNPSRYSTASLPRDFFGHVLLPPPPPPPTASDPHEVLGTLTKSQWHGFHAAKTDDGVRVHRVRYTYFHRERPDATYLSSLTARVLVIIFVTRRFRKRNKLINFRLARHNFRRSRDFRFITLEGVGTMPPEN